MPACDMRSPRVAGAPMNSRPARLLRWLIAFLAVRVALTATLLADWADGGREREP